MMLVFVTGAYGFGLNIDYIKTGNSWIYRYKRSYTNNLGGGSEYEGKVRIEIIDAQRINETLLFTVKNTDTVECITSYGPSRQPLGSRHGGIDSNILQLAYFKDTLFQYNDSSNGFVLLHDLKNYVTTEMPPVVPSRDYASQEETPVAERRDLFLYVNALDSNVQEYSNSEYYYLIGTGLIYFKNDKYGGLITGSWEFQLISFNSIVFNVVNVLPDIVPLEPPIASKPRISKSMLNIPAKSGISIYTLAGKRLAPSGNYFKAAQLTVSNGMARLNGNRLKP